MAPRSTRKALFSEGNVPPGGTCLSAFVIISSGSRILVGKMAKPDTWVNKFFVGPKFVADYVKSGKFVLPARHLAWYESPLDAAHSVVGEQVGFKVAKSKIKLLDVQSHLRGEIGSEEKPAHWDLCFVYGVNLTDGQARKLRSPTWFKDLGFKPTGDLSSGDFARGHGDILEETGTIRSG